MTCPAGCNRRQVSAPPESPSGRAWESREPRGSQALSATRGCSCPAPGGCLRAPGKLPTAMTKLSQTCGPVAAHTPSADVALLPASSVTCAHGKGPRTGRGISKSRVVSSNSHVLFPQTPHFLPGASHLGCRTPKGRGPSLFQGRSLRTSRALRRRGHAGKSGDHPPPPQKNSTSFGRQTTHLCDCATLNLHSLRAAPLLSTELWPRATLDIVGSTHGNFPPSIGFLGSLSLSPKCIFGLSSFSMQSCEGHIGLVLTGRQATSSRCPREAIRRAPHQGGPPHAAVAVRVGSQLPVGTQESRDGTEGCRPTTSTGKRANQSRPHACPLPLAPSSLLSPQGRGRQGGLKAGCPPVCGEGQWGPGGPHPQSRT